MNILLPHWLSISIPAKFKLAALIMTLSHGPIDGNIWIFLYGEGNKSELLNMSEGYDWTIGYDGFTVYDGSKIPIPFSSTGIL